MARGSKSKSKHGRPGGRSRTPEALPAVRLHAEGELGVPRADSRRWIYSGLDLAFGLMQLILIWKVVPNRLPSASFHLLTLPAMTLLMGVGMMLGGPRGWKIAVVAGSVALFSTVLLILRIVISAAFLSGVYGAFGKAAAMTAMMSVALLVELVALLPIVQVKYLLTRGGRRTFGKPAR
jgi:hypothetical protein